MVSHNLTTTNYNDEAISQYVKLASKDDWHTPLMAAPICVLQIAHAMLISVKTDDISLEACRPPNGFTYLRQPQSLRASMRQVSNEAYDAMHTAHINMHRISLAADGIPNHIRVMYEAVENYSPREREERMPAEAEFIRSEAANCEKWAKNVVSEFESTKRLLNEVLECCQGRQGMSQREASQKKKEKHDYDLQVARAESKLETYKADETNNLAMRQQLQRDAEALSKTSTGEKIIDGVFKVAEVIGTVVGAAARNFVGLPAAKSSGAPSKNLSKDVDPLSSVEMTDLRGLDTGYSRFLACADDLMVSQARDLANFLSGFSTYGGIFNDLRKYPLYVTKESQDLDMSNKQAKSKQLKHDATEALKRFQNMVRNSETMRKQFAEGEQDLRDRRVIASARREKLKLTTRLHHSVIQQEKIINQRMAAAKAQQESAERALVEIQGESATIANTINLLTHVLVQLNDLGKQWKEISTFFHLLSNSMAQASKDIHHTARLLENASVAGMVVTDAYSEGLLDACIKAHAQAKFVHLTSSMYFDVSKKFFLEDLNTLPGILNMTPEAAVLEVERRKVRLSTSREGIEELVLKKHKEMVRFMTGFVERGKQDYVKTALPYQEKLRAEEAIEIEIQGQIEAEEVTSAQLRDEQLVNQSKCHYTGDAC
ncbi:Aste57867_1409 [Aphanomyces stellatus]|uniref:Aste57867_1409 protein n=1 Tax=Aphanomyces stellatus TaxID=120398 RepID=A0A485KAK2_9STRA|nr:hypothetical protein As57867_001408 [Aphanomyces stellatus]VFT78626.1 Aste57867_1409 [Aphanomyces stellatus]